MLLEFLISLTDIYIASFFGKETQGAVGFVSQIYFVFTVLGNALTVGGISIISRLFGEGNKSKLAQASSTIILSSAFAGLTLCALGYITAPWFISHADIPHSIAKIAVPYILISFAGLPFHYLLISSNGLLRASRRPVRSLVTMFCVAACNISLNLFFAFNTHLGFKGIALSTVLSYVAGFILNAKLTYIFIGRSVTFSKKILFQTIKIAWPTMVTQVSWQTGSVVLFLVLAAIPHNAVEIMAAFTTGLRIESAIYLPAYALNMSAAVLVGNLIGSKKKSDAFAAGLATAFIGFFIILALSALVIFNAKTLAGAFTKSPLVARECVRYLVIQMLSEPFMVILVTLSGALNGAGDTFGVMRIVVGGMWIIRVPLSWFFAIHLGFGQIAVWWVMNLDIIVRMVFIVERYWRRRWLIHE